MQRIGIIGVGLLGSAVAEALALAAKGGLDPATLLAAIQHSAASSRMLEVRGPLMVSGAFPPQMKLELFLKDLGLMLEEGQRLSVPLPLTSTAQRLYAAAAEAGAGAQDLAVVIMQLERMAGLARPPLEETAMPRYVDLSVTVDAHTMSPPSTNLPVELTPHRRGPGFWQVTSVHQSLHTGAHVDSPLHVFKDGITTAEIRLEQVMGEALVIDLSFADANHGLTIDDLRRGGADRVRSGDIVLLRTDWTDKKYGTWPDYFTQSPFFPPESAEWLVAKGPKSIGFDFFEEYCARLPDFTSEDFRMHRVILGAGIVIMEGLTNLGALPSRQRVPFYAPFYKIAGTEGAPARFFAMVE